MLLVQLAKKPHTQTEKKNLQMSQPLVWGENCCLQSNSLICSSLVQLAINFEGKMTFVFAVSEAPEVYGEKKKEIKIFLGF